MTPKVKTSQHEEKLKNLERVYRELEEHFSVRKCLNWTATNGKQNEHEEDTKVSNKKDNEFKNTVSKGTIAGIKEDVEHNEMVKLLEDLEKDVVDVIHDESHLTALYDKKTKAIIPLNTALDKMQVSDCSSLNTQATFNDTEKTRSNSPDLFADSDVEIEGQDDNKDESKRKDIKRISQYKSFFFFS